MNSIGKTLFGRLYYFNKQAHFQVRKEGLYCETFSLIDQAKFYGIFNYTKVNINNEKFELYSSLLVGCNDSGLKWQEKYRFVNEIETITSNIPENIQQVILTNKNNSHIVNCSCCHRY